MKANKTWNDTLVADRAAMARSLLRRLKKSPPTVVNARSGPEGYRSCESETKGCTRCRNRRCWVDIQVRSGAQNTDFSSSPTSSLPRRAGRCRQSAPSCSCHFGRSCHCHGCHARLLPHSWTCRGSAGHPPSGPGYRSGASGNHGRRNWCERVPASFACIAEQ